LEGETMTQPPVSETQGLDLTEFAQMLRDRRGALSIRQAAADAGVSFSTFSRVEAGAHPDLATFTRLCSWLRIPAARFFNTVPERQMTPLDEAVTHLRSDPRLTPDARSKLTSVLTDLYNALAQDVPPPRRVVACHLRAASMMRPGVPHRLAALLTDMRGELERKVQAGEL
jgi:transcriptional regulator with XRE-family HTH domain